MNSKTLKIFETAAIVVIGVGIFLWSHAYAALPQLPVLGQSWVLFIYMLGLIAWLKVRSEKLADYGLSRPSKWWLAGLIGFGMAVLLEIYALILNPLLLAGLKPYIGSHTVLQRFDILHGNLQLYLMVLPLIWLSAGFMEEFLFRGFLFNRLLMIFGKGPFAWMTAALIQAALFSIAHIYQGWPGVVTVAMTSFFLLAASRILKGNLWPAIIMHCIVDSASLLYIVLAGTPK